MIKYKTPEEIKIMAQGGKKLNQVVKRLLKDIKPGVKTIDIDNQAEYLIKKAGGESSFKKVKDYDWTTCLSVNEQIVHTPPSERILKEGDILTLDIGMYYQGFHTDFATTFFIGKSTRPEIDRFLLVGKKTLKKAIKKLKKGCFLGDISKIINQEITKNNYFIIRQLAGHGIGRDLHEDPIVLNYLDKPVNRTLKISPGLVIAIEVIYSLGTSEMKMEGIDNWSIVTKDGSQAACFEHTIAVLSNKVFILT